MQRQVRMSAGVLAGCLVALLAPRSIAQQTIFVTLDPTGEEFCDFPFKDGSSWDMAFFCLEDGLEEAKAVAGPDNPVEIRVAEGVYRPKTNLVGNVPADDRDKTFTLQDYVTLTGGWAGPGDPDARDPAVYETVLTGSLGGGVFAFHVVSAKEQQEGVVLDGFTIRDGRAIDGGDRDGGGLWSRDSRVTVRNCLFIDNQARRRGGAASANSVNVTLESRLTFEECRFEDNRLIGGENEIGDTGGGALHGSPGTSIDAKECWFIANETTDSSPADGKPGGALRLNGADGRFTNCCFFGNRSKGSGGAGGAISVQSAPAPVEFVNCVMSGNVAQIGSALWAAQSDVDIHSSTLSNNDSPGPNQPHILIGGGSSLTIRNSILWSEAQGNMFDLQNDNDLDMQFTCTAENAPGEGNIFGDPMFENELGTDGILGTEDDVFGLTLTPFSPCIDRGDDGSLPEDTFDLNFNGDTDEPLPLDALGGPRINDGLSFPFDFVSVTDMGAIEASCPTCDAQVCKDVATRWFLAGDGDVNDEARWSNCVPALERIAVFDVPGQYTVSNLDGLPVSSSGLVVDGVDLTLDLGNEGNPGLLDLSQDPIGASLTVAPGDGSGLDSLLTILNGEIRFSSNASPIVGDAPDAIAGLVLAGEDATLTDASVLTVAQQGTAFLDLLDGADVSLTNRLVIGEITDPDSFGSVTLQGAGSSLSAPGGGLLDRGELRVLDAAATAAKVTIAQPGSLFGDGLVQSGVVNLGRVLPGPVSGEPGALSIDSNYDQIDTDTGNAVGTLIVDVATASDTGLPAADSLMVTGLAQLDGGVVINIAEGFSLPDGTESVSIPIVNAESLEGTSFDVALINGLPPDLFLTLDFNETQASLVIAKQEQLGSDLEAGGGNTVGGLPGGADTGFFSADQDEFPDLAVSVPGGNNGSEVLLVFNNNGVDDEGSWNGFGTQVLAIEIGDIEEDAAFVLLRDFDGDGFDDIALLSREEGVFQVYRNNGANGVMLSPFETALAPGGVALATGEAIEDFSGDFDGDGDWDCLALTAGANPRLWFMENNSTIGNIGFEPCDEPVDDLPCSVDPIDPDGDGDFDAAVTRDDGFLTIIVNEGGSFIQPDPPISFKVGEDPGQVVSVDLNGDGQRDLVTVNAGSDDISVLLNESSNGEIAFTPASNLPVGENPTSITALDVDEDGDSDLAVVATVDLEGVATRVVEVLRNDTEPGGNVVLTNIGSFLGGDDGEPFLVLSDDLDQDGTDDLIALNESGAESGQDDPEVIPLLSDLDEDCLADCNSDGELDVFDFICFQQAFSDGAPSADCNDDGTPDIFDFICFQQAFNQGC